MKQGRPLNIVGTLLLAAPIPIWSFVVMSFPVPFTSLAHWLTLIVAGLRQAAAARAGHDRAVAPLVLLLWNRLARLLARFDALVARLAAGRPAAGRRQRTRPASAAPARAAPAAALHLPRSHSWLIRLLPGEAASTAASFRPCSPTRRWRPC